MRSTIRKVLFAPLALGCLLQTAAAIEVRQLTSGGHYADSGNDTPAWSPDGTRIALTSWWVDPGHWYFIFGVIGIVRVEDGAALEFPSGYPPGVYDAVITEPTWSPGGDFVAYSIVGPLWIGAVDSVRHIPLNVYGRQPDWSPDGTRIAYAGVDGGIYVIPAMGGTPVSIAPGWNPAWSPDGGWLAYADGDTEGRDIWIVPAAGGEPRPLTQGPANDDDPTWSPDGRLLAFVSDRSGNRDIWVVRLENGALSQLTDDPADDWAPDWSPDGQQIVFVSSRSARSDLWIASDLRTIAVQPTSWTSVKQLFR